MNILSNIGLTICGFIFLLFIIYGYIKSKKFKTFESVLFRIMLITITISSIIEIAFGFLVINTSELYNLQNILVKIYIFMTMLWLNSLTLYLIITPHKDYITKNKKYIFISLGILVLMTVGPFIYKNVFNQIPILGPNNVVGSINTVYGHPTHFCAIPLAIAMISLLFTSFGKMEKTVRIPFLCVIVTLLAEVFITFVVKKELNELTFVFELITIIIYLTSESVNIKLIKEINETKEESEIALDGQNEFISSMSHDIRTPLGNLIGISEVLLHDNNLTLEKTKEELSSVKDASEKLTELLKNLIDVSKINDGSLTITNTQISVKAMTEYVAKLLNAKAIKKNNTYASNVSERMSSTIEGDFDKITRTIILLVNAIIAKTENGSITANYSGEVAGDIYYFKVDIEGINSKLTVEDLNIDFNTYMEMYSDKINTIDSEKLGIIIAKYYIQLLNGSINYLVDQTGKTIYSITIPVSLGRGE